MTEPDYKAMYEAERDKFQGETRVSWFLAERLRGARGSANRCDQCRQARGEWVVRRGDEVLWLCHPCTAGIRADVPPFIGAAEAAVAAAAPILLAAERARIAAAIQADANFEPGCEHDIGFYDGLMRAARLAETAPEPCLCAGHYMACDEPCPDFWLPDVPMSPDKGHAETAPEEGP